LYDKKNHAVGAVHSGWRGTVALILEKTLRAMNAEFGTKGEDLLAGIGPSVCQESYEVGEEVVAEVEKAFGARQSNLMIPQPNNKAKLDLWRANEIQLLEFGVLKSNIEISDLCTVKNNNYFFSARKGDAGRFAAGIMLA
jgi:polyphenol oxidase